MIEFHRDEEFVYPLSTCHVFRSSVIVEMGPAEVHVAWRYGIVMNNMLTSDCPKIPR